MRRLRDDLVSAIIQFYDAHVPYVLDLGVFSVMKKTCSRGRDVFVPFFDTFDFDVPIDDPDTPWADLRQDQIGTVKAQFDVLEVKQSRLHPFLSASFQCIFPAHNY